MKTVRNISLMLILFFFLSGLPALCTILSHSAAEDPSFLEQEMAWRKNRDTRMRAHTSWLTIAGLFWLIEGENSFGSSSENNIKLPESSSPPLAGKFIFKDNVVSVIAHPGVQFKVKSNPVTQMTLKADDSGDSDILELNNLNMWVIKRGDRYAIRLRDLNAPPFKNYTGLDFFPPSEKFRIEADFVPFPSPKSVSVETVIGTETEMISPGHVKFTLDGKEFSLLAFQDDDNSLFFVFRDETSGIETYEASRFMVSQILENGKVDLNFNRAYNPPCAYTPYATCPLPPPENELKLRIEAGEKKFPGGHH